MVNLVPLHAKGAYDILVGLSLGDARFRDLNDVVRNTRTLTRRLRELEATDFIVRVGRVYRITEAGFDALMRVYDVELGSESIWVNRDEFERLGHGWLKIPLKRLVKLFLEELGHGLISIAVYGSSVKGSFKMGKSDIDLLYIIEGHAENSSARESKVFKQFESTYEYRAFNHWFRMKGFYGYPEITSTSIRRSHALNFQPIYLDMIFHKAILYDKEGFLKGLILKLQDRLRSLGALRVEYADGSWYWVLKPDLKPGERLEIDLRRD